IGGIAGHNRNEIIECGVKEIKIRELSGKEFSIAYVGGIVGYSSKGEIKSCIVDKIEVEKVLKCSWIGGILAFDDNKAKIIDCKVESLELKSIDDNKAKIIDCKVESLELKSISEGCVLGGIVGVLEKTVEKSEIENCVSKIKFSEKTIKSESIKKGGLIGKINWSGLGEKIQSRLIQGGILSGSDGVISSATMGVEIKNCYYIKDINKKINKGLYGVGGYKSDKDGVKALVEVEINKKIKELGLSRESDKKDNLEEIEMIRARKVVGELEENVEEKIEIREVEGTEKQKYKKKAATKKNTKKNFRKPKR
ncbi:MAG: hypothetical protein J6C08_03055, partial [Campylobacter sp.]|uniref:hypothetical protein n=1 Tax=Campylobacter sp. TaxID=205 RepID=UPI001B1137BA